jgi:cytochrome c556
MVQHRLQSLRPALMARLLGVVMLAPASPAFAEPIDRQENSLQSTVDGFVAYLKSETNEAMTAATRAARDNKETIEAANARIDATIANLRETLNGQKARLEILGKDATAMSEAWREAAISSWAKIERSAHDALDWIEAWMRNQSLSDQSPEIPV